MIRTSSVRFFLVVSPSPVWMRFALGAAVVIGLVTLWLNPGEVDSALGSVLLLQMFSVSGGYAASADRGHYDPLLVSGRSRIRVALGNLVAASMPCLLAWLVLVMFATSLGQGHAALLPHRQAALVIVSALAWAGGLALPRLSAGALWSGILLTLALSRTSVGDYLAVVQAPPASIHAELASAVAFAVCPFLLLGDFAAARSAPVIVCDLVLAGACALGGAAYVSRREYCLVEPA